MIETDLFRAPPDQTQVPAKAKALGRREAIDWFAYEARYIWSKSSRGGYSNWNILFDPNGANDPNRIDAQVYRRTLIHRAAASQRLPAPRSGDWQPTPLGLTDLYLAGTWIDTGFNTECIEAAVISGMQAARAISGASLAIPGEDFLGFGNDFLSLITLAAEKGILLLEAVASAAWSSSSAEMHRRSIRHRSAGRKDRR